MISTPTRLLRLVAMLALFAAGTGALAPATGAQDAPTLLVDDAATANADLVPVDVMDPAGIGVPVETLLAPEGATVAVIAGDLDRPRFMAFDAAGNLLATDANTGTVYRYAYTDGTLGTQETLITDLGEPASVALFTDGDTEYLYVGEQHQVSRFAYGPDGSVGEQEVVIADLPVGGHSTRTVAFGPDGMLYLAVGSSCNICTEDDEIRATVSRANPDGTDLQIIATGLRNPVGLDFQPGTDQLWTTVNERDNQGDEIPPDLMTVVTEGANYGWPACMPPDAIPQEAGADCAGVTPPTIGIQAHSAPLGLTFLDGDGVPADFDGDLIVAQHGSWNRQPPAAPKLLLIEFENGEPVGAADFVTGWQDDDGERSGRPAGVVVAPDGSLIVSDDASGLLYRITLPQ